MPRLHSPLWPDRSQKPPYGAVEIDWAHPLAQGLKGYWLLPNCADLTRAHLVVPSGATPNAGAWGQGTLFDASTERLLGSTDLIAKATTAYTLIVRARITSVNTSSRALVCYNIPEADSWNASLWLSDAGTNSVRALSRSHEGDYFIAEWTSGWAAGTDHQFIAHYDNVNISSGGDGVLRASTLKSGAVRSGSGQVWAIGNDSNASPTQNADALIYDVAWYTRALSSVELLQLYADPYCFLRPVLRRSYGFVGAAAGLSIPVAMAQYRQRWS